MKNMKEFINPQIVSAPFHLIKGKWDCIAGVYKVKHFSTEGLQ